jgi:protease-4
MKKPKSKVSRFIRMLWNTVTVIRHFVGNLLFLLVIILLIIVFLFDTAPKVPRGVALILSPSGNIVEQKSGYVPMDLLFGQVAQETLLKDIVDGIDHAKDDDHIEALVLDLDTMYAAGISKLQEIGAALKRFKKSGKTIIAVGDHFNQNQYYLAAHADKIYLHPMGHVFLSGYGLYRKYVKRALEKLMVQVHVFRVGTYKSALEPFLRDDMSDEARQANLSWLNDLWDDYKSDIADLRGMDAGRIDGYINGAADHLAKVEGDIAKLALELGFVDALKTRDEVRGELIALVGEDNKTNAYKHIHLNQYLEIIRPALLPADHRLGKVGIIIAKGLILDGEQPSGRIGGDTLAELIRQARHNRQIKAVVLRIDSGGGSAFASEIIRKEVELTRSSGKPVVASMSSAAASGAYWIATAADEIWASPTTLTGSIGIFSAFATFDKTLNHLGINTDGIGTTELSGSFDPSRPLNPVLAAVLQRTIAQGYKRFIERVAEGRKLSPEDVEKAAQGRVWSGKEALTLGLVDKLGDLKSAVQSAAGLAGLDDFEVIYLERPLSAREQIMKKFERLIFRLWQPTDRSIQPPALRFYRSADAELKQFLQLNDPQGVYAYCLTCEVQ